MGRTAKIMRASAAPVVIDGITIPPPQYRTRVLMETNLSPEGGQYESHAYLSTLGMKRVVLGYAALFNRASWWAPYKSLAEYQQHGQAGPEGKIETEPPTEVACRAIGSLLANPTRFGGVSEPNPPLVLDIESGVNVFRPTDTPDERLVKIQSWRNAFGWIRAEAGQAQEIWYYDAVGYDTPTATQRDDVDAAMAEWRAQPEAYDGYFYFWDGHLIDPTRWYADACALIASIRKVQPTGGVVTISYVQNVYWPDQRPQFAHLNGTPVPFDIWCMVVTLFASAGLTLVLWTGNSPIAGFQAHAAFFARHAAG